MSGFCNGSSPASFMILSLYLVFPSFNMTRLIMGLNVGYFFCCLFTIFYAWLQSIFKWYFHHHIGKILESFYFNYLSSSAPLFFPAPTIMCLLHLLKSLTVLECPSSLLFPISFSVHI